MDLILQTILEELEYRVEGLEYGVEDNIEPLRRLESCIFSGAMQYSGDIDHLENVDPAIPGTCDLTDVLLTFSHL